MLVRDALSIYRDQALVHRRRGHATYRSLTLLFEPAELEDLRALSTEALAALIERMAVGAPVHAQRAHAYAAPFLKWAEEQGLIADRPLAPLARPPQSVRRDRRLSIAEVRTVWLAAAGLSRPFGPAIGLLLLTAAYRDDVGALRVSELARDARASWTWRPRARATAEGGLAIPLPPAAVRLIKEVLDHRKPGADFVLGATGATPLSGWSQAKRRLDGLIQKRDPEATPMAPWRLNDLRATFAAHAADELAIDPQVIERCLGRVSGYASPIAKEWAGSEAMLGEHRSALERWADLVISD
jgi:integrase